MNVEVVVPWRGGCSHRDASVTWLLERLPYKTTIAKAEGPWIKANAVTPAVEASSADIIVMHDADVWCDDGWLERAIAEVEDGAPWAMPHERVRRLSPKATEAVLCGQIDLQDAELIEHHQGTWGGGIMVIPRETYLSCPLDPRFVGWGCEDISWANALWQLAGKGWRGDGVLYHFWHPPQSRLTRSRGSAENVALAIRYRQARFRPDKMRALVNEFLEADAHGSAQQAVSDPAPV